MAGRICSVMTRRREVPPRFPKEISCDNDRSFLGAFERHSHRLAFSWHTDHTGLQQEYRDGLIRFTPEGMVRATPEEAARAQRSTEIANRWGRLAEALSAAAVAAARGYMVMRARRIWGRLGNVLGDGV